MFYFASGTQETLPYKLNRQFLSRGQSLLVQLQRNI